MLDLLLADVTAGPLAEVCILECPLVISIIMNEDPQPLGILLNDPNQVGGLTANIPKFHDITLLYVLWLPKFLQAELYHFQYTQRDVKLQSWPKVCGTQAD